MNNNLIEGDIYAPNYVVDSFTQNNLDINLEVDNANIKCLTSKNNKFSLDSDGNLVVNSITCNNSLCNLLDVYPIGSIYMNFTNVNPSNLFGGTWRQLKGRFLVGQGACEANTTDWFGNCEAGWTDMLEAEMGGEVTHKLTVNEMPSHYHDTAMYNYGTKNVNGGFNFTYANKNSGWHDGLGTMYIKPTGGNQTHNNMPPYIVVYMWQRIS